MAGGILRTSIQRALNLLLLLLLLRRFLACVCAFTLKSRRAPMSFECLFSMALLRGALQLQAALHTGPPAGGWVGVLQGLHQPGDDQGKAVRLDPRVCKHGIRRPSHWVSDSMPVCDNL